ncbi:hypothetical protein Tco_0615640 [Tanacetum coccineum]
MHKACGNLSLLCNFVEKYLGTVRFGNDQFAPILGYGDLVQGNITIKGFTTSRSQSNLFSVANSVMRIWEVAFRNPRVFVRDLQGNGLLTQSPTQVVIGIETFSSQLRLHQLFQRRCCDWFTKLKFDEIKEMSETSVANDTSGLVPQRQKASDYENPDPAPNLQNVSSSADTTVPSQQ